MHRFVRLQRTFTLATPFVDTRTDRLASDAARRSDSSQPRISSRGWVVTVLPLCELNVASNWRSVSLAWQRSSKLLRIPLRPPFRFSSK